MLIAPPNIQGANTYGILLVIADRLQLAIELSDSSVLP
jgi:hypothetical protein